MKFRIYHYWRSSSSWRVRWAFAIKGIQCEFVPINLLSDEPESESHKMRNPMGYVPVLEFLETPSPFRYLTESVAIIEWLEETFPTPSLFPTDPFQKARSRQLAEIINSGTQPLQNPTVALFHSKEPSEQKTWNQHWITRGLQAYETLVKESAGQFSVGNEVTMADLFLIPQCYNALRNEVKVDKFPTIQRIYSAALETRHCQASAPDLFQPTP